MLEREGRGLFEVVELGDDEGPTEPDFAPDTVPLTDEVPAIDTVADTDWVDVPEGVGAPDPVAKDGVGAEEPVEAAESVAAGVDVLVLNGVAVEKEAEDATDALGMVDVDAECVVVVVWEAVEEVSGDTLAPELGVGTIEKLAREVKAPVEDPDRVPTAEGEALLDREEVIEVLGDATGVEEGSLEREATTDTVPSSVGVPLPLPRPL